MSESKIYLASLVADIFEIDTKEAKQKIDILVNQITIELSKGSTIYHPSFITFTPAIREATVKSIPFISKPVQINAHIYPRTSLSRQFLKKIKSYELKNLNLL